MNGRFPTVAALVVELLAARDDFMTHQQIQAVLAPRYHKDLPVTTVWSLLLWLRHMDVVDVVIQQGKSYWFLRPCEFDKRTRHIDERKPMKPRALRIKRPPTMTGEMK